METRADAFIDRGLSALETSLRDHDGDLRNAQLATVSPEGRPRVRTLVLRGFRRSPASAEAHTDSRAQKTRDIGGCAHVALLCWSHAENLQIRLQGTARLHRDDDVARGRWESLSSSARKAYGRVAEPGLAIDDPDDQSVLPPEQQFQNFTVVVVSLGSVDILRLGPEGRQVRALGRFTPAGIAATWIGA